ncbi:MAG TPA: rhomboid family intramembrane serine protease [Verrucomicrobiae bacterium]|nr:rhomboid family intramembrane serine protease [Verrucomicrobiae bacterium]
MIVILPVGMNYQTGRLPLVTFSIIGLNTLVYLVSLICSINTGGVSNDWIFEHLWLIPGESYWWTYLTSMFVHAGIFHLLGNMIYLFLFGCCVEDMIGRVRFTVFYLVSGILAALSYIAFTPEHFESMMPMGGASGAITACMGMYLLLRAKTDIEFKYFYWLFFIAFGSGEFVLPAWVAISFWFAKDLFWMVFGFYFHQTGGGTAFGAHVGGFLAGLGLVAAYKWIGRRHEATDESEPLSSNPGPIRVTVPTRRMVHPTETPTIFVHDGTQQTGPFTLSQVQAMLHAGEISREMQYWCEGLDNWQSVTELSGQPGG